MDVALKSTNNYDNKFSNLVVCYEDERKIIKIKSVMGTWIKLTVKSIIIYILFYAVLTR